MFIRALAAGRGVSVDKVRSDFGQGRVVRMDTAQALGMVDRVEMHALDAALVSFRAALGPNARQKADLLAEQQALVDKLTH